MYEEMTYGPWLIEGSKYKQKYYLLQGIGLTVWAIGFLLGAYVFEQPFFLAVMIGFVPYFLLYLAAMDYYERWQNCEENYSRHIPYVDVKVMNVILTAIEFVPGKVICAYQNYNGTEKVIELPADQVKILPADEGENVLKLRKEIRNSDKTESWKYIHIYLTPEMQQKLLALRNE